MERISFIAHVVEVGGEAPGAPGVRVLVGGATEHEAISVEFSVKSLLDFLEGKAISTMCGALVCFSAENGFFRLRSSKESVSAFLSAELNVELTRMLRELHPEEG